VQQSLPKQSALEDRLREALARHEQRRFPDVRPDLERVDAAVLVPLRLRETPTVTMFVRASGLEHHAGEVGFPGGKRQEGDESLRATALREAHEEIGLDPGDVELIGALSPVPVATSRFRLNPFVGIVLPRAAPWVPSPEVGRVLDLPLEGFFHGTFEHRAVPIVWAGHEILSPFFVVAPETRLYGASSYVLLELLGIVGPMLGLELPTPIVSEQAPWPWTPERAGFRK
jgi:8-oxo-dGTP pyrophosphatase MutT (NUDIX family)